MVARNAGLRPMTAVDALRQAASTGAKFYLMQKATFEGEEARALLAIVDAYGFEDVRDAVRFAVSSVAGMDGGDVLLKRMAHKAVVEEVRAFVVGKISEAVSEIHRELTEQTRGQP